MKGSGLEELFEQVYAVNSVPMIISGTSVARAVRAHTLAHSALMSLLLDEVKESEAKDRMKALHRKALNRDLQQVDIDEMVSSTGYLSLLEEIDEVKMNARNRSRTSSLWLSYMEYVEISEQFIAAERTSKWNSHLQSLRKMLNLFAATAHRNYAKSARYYYQEMKKLPQTHPKLHDLFINGRHTVHRSKKHYNGIPTDLCIEQTVMRSAKTQGGLIGRSWSEPSMKTWVLSMSSTAYIHDVMAKLTGTQSVSRDQYVELGSSRIIKDNKDLKIMIDYLKSRNPLSIESPHLHSISNGVVARLGGDDVSCDRAESMGQFIHTKLDHLPYNNCSIKQRYVSKPLSSLCVVKKEKNFVSTTDSSVLFSRSVIASQRLAS